MLHNKCNMFGNLGGSCGIRTHVPLARLTPFQGGTIGQLCQTSINFWAARTGIEPANKFAVSIHLYRVRDTNLRTGPCHILTHSQTSAEFACTMHYMLRYFVSLHTQCTSSSLRCGLLLDRSVLIYEKG